MTTAFFERTMAAAFLAALPGVVGAQGVAAFPTKPVRVVVPQATGGRIDATLANVLSASHYVGTGKLRALGISTTERSRVIPDLPTIAEQGAPGYNASTFHGYAVPIR